MLIWTIQVISESRRERGRISSLKWGKKHFFTKFFGEQKKKIRTSTTWKIFKFPSQNGALNPPLVQAQNVLAWILLKMKGKCNFLWKDGHKFRKCAKNNQKLYRDKNNLKKPTPSKTECLVKRIKKQSQGRNSLKLKGFSDRKQWTVKIFQDKIEVTAIFLHYKLITNSLVHPISGYNEFACVDRFQWNISGISNVLKMFTRHKSIVPKINI